MEHLGKEILEEMADQILAVVEAVERERLEVTPLLMEEPVELV